MSISGCVSFYNDSPELLERALKSLKGKVDSILAVDGVYREFPMIDGFKPWSTDGCLDVAKKYADRVIETKLPWYDQVSKRNAYLQLLSSEDFYFILDADEELMGELPKRLPFDVYEIEIIAHMNSMNPTKTRGARLIRHKQGISYSHKHAFIWVNNFIINRQEYALNDIAKLQDCHIEHRPHERSKEWLEADGQYIRIRDENTARMPQPSPQSPRDKCDLVRLKFFGKHYNGYDAVTKEHFATKEGQFAFVSVEKSQQLVNDYPNDWRFFGVLKKQERQHTGKVMNEPLGV